MVIKFDTGERREYPSNLVAVYPDRLQVQVTHRPTQVAHEQKLPAPTIPFTFTA